MKVCCCIVKRNESVSVRTLHALLRLLNVSRRNNIQLQLEYVSDTCHDTNGLIKKLVKTCDRLMWIGYGVGMELGVMDMMVSPYPAGYHGLVVPTVLEGIDWDMFVAKIKAGSEEPPNQIGMHFDTETTTTKISDYMYAVKSTKPRLWSLDCKQFVKKMKGKKGEGLVVPKEDMFGAMIKNGVKVCAFVTPITTVTYTHECTGSIMETIVKNKQ